ncbi:MAG: YcxB family protein [Chloroflexi bacterium]|nr:MAG: YcxB family protein [Chloroflexota bacterium]MBL1194604.1 YcxB family protein [Chloroflexota bacterium]NOH11894.1 YcxB family protein [Chloroflexota bacterium]
MKIKGQLNWQDYRSAQRLHASPFKKSNPIITGFGIVLAIGAVLTLLLANDQGLEILLYGLIFGAGSYILGRIIFIPNRAKRIFKQQKELQAPIEMEFTESAFSAVNEFGASSHPWNTFTRWLENKDVFLLYHSDTLYSIIPKRMLTTEQSDLVRQYLKENIQETSQRSRLGCIIWAVLLLFAVMVFLVFNFQQQVASLFW